MKCSYEGCADSDYANYSFDICAFVLLSNAQTIDSNGADEIYKLAN